MARSRAARAGGGGEGERSPASQRLVEAALRGDSGELEEELLAAGAAVDLEFVGTVTLRVRTAEEIPGEEMASGEVRIGHEDFRTDVTALFSAAHAGHTEIVKKLLSVGADVNHKIFRGYPTSAAAREGHCAVLELLLGAGASSEAREEALLEASICNEPEAVRLLMSFETATPSSASHALVAVSSKGFIAVVEALVENGVGVDCVDRVLLRSSKPVLHANVDCTPLAAAIVGRHVPIVKFLLEVGAGTDYLVRVGAWTWDRISGEEIRVGACLGKAYNVAWCAVEYYESSGEILRQLFLHWPALLNDPYSGRSLLCHAILCQNSSAVRLLLNSGANPGFIIRAGGGHESRPIHLAARIGSVVVLRELIHHGCDIDSRTSSGESALMVSAVAGNPECFLELLMSGADLAVLCNSGENAVQLAERSGFGASIVDFFKQVLISEKPIFSSNIEAFSPLHFAAASGDPELLQMILLSSVDSLNRLDRSGLTPVMVASESGGSETFRHLVMAGADIDRLSRDGRSLVSIIRKESRGSLEEILLDATLANVTSDQATFSALHYAARKGKLSSMIQLLKMGCPVDALDETGCSALMLASMEGQAEACKLLLLYGADCRLANAGLETPLCLSRRSVRSNKATENVLLDHLAWSHVLGGEELLKHTRGGRGPPHRKTVRMLEAGVLTWGRTARRNVAVKQAVEGMGSSFAKGVGGGVGRWCAADEEDDGSGKRKMIFHVVSEAGREVHFEVCSASALTLWVRGLNLVVKENCSVSMAAASPC